MSGLGGGGYGRGLRDACLLACSHASDTPSLPTPSPSPARPVERARSLFEGVLRNHPRRLDLWSVYLDQEISRGEQQRIRCARAQLQCARVGGAPLAPMICGRLSYPPAPLARTPMHALAPTPAPPHTRARRRSLFERATHLQLPPRKMKFLFKRYLDYERARGTPAGVEHVKRRAMEYVEEAAAAAAAGGGA